MTLFVCSLQFVSKWASGFATAERLYSCLMMEKSTVKHIHGGEGGEEWAREVDNGRQRKFKLLFNDIINSQPNLSRGPQCGKIEVDGGTKEVH